jgi:xylan 1,4-beta-xylosidase
MKDGKKLLGELGQLGGPQVYFRAHHLLTSGDGAYALKWSSTSAYKEDANGNPVYDWTINDKIFDTYLERGVKPYVEIGFMPEALSTHPQDYPHNPPVKERAPANAGQAYPPKDYAKWGELVYQWTKHCVEKYGADEVNKWYWEVWNEPNISYWHGTHAGLFQALRLRRGRRAPRVADRARRRAGNGGRRRAEIFCATISGTLRARHKLRHRKDGSPLDFISFHAKGSPVFTERPRPHGHEQRVAEHERRLRRRRLVSRIQKHAHRHRRIRSRRLRRLHADRRMATATARCIRATPPRLFRARSTSRTNTA